MGTDRPLIVITNDDGVMSKGIDALIKYIRPLGEILVMAPDSPRSGASGSLTVQIPIHYQLLHKEIDLAVYKCSGTPVDCVKLAVDEVCTRRPDLIVAGINHGDNSSTNVFNSGTMGAVIEGCLEGIHSIAFSLCSHDPNADFELLSSYVCSITSWVIKEGLPKLTCLNINFPNVPNYKGLKVCKMARGKWKHEFDPCPRKGDQQYFWLGGEFVDEDSDDKLSDHYALANGYVAITPTKLDITDYAYIDKLQQEMDLL